MSYEGELIERDSMIDLHAAATPEVVESLGLRALTVGGAFVSIASRLPATAVVLNRTLGLGLTKTETRADIVETVNTYRTIGVERFFVQVHPDAAPSTIGDWLVAEGLEKARGWQKFCRGREAVRRGTADFRIDEIGPEHGAAFARIACNAFDLGDAAVPWLAALAGRSRWHIFMAFVGDEPAGIGALYVEDDIGSTDLGATAPRFRGRGIQQAVLARRIECALDLGCREIVTCTGVAVPGDPQHSYSNIKRAGFRETYVRENYAPPRQ
jgi:GNAT superfamily N-acetyltransferase